VDVEGYGRLSAQVGFVCTSWVIHWRGNECKLGGWPKCECVWRQKGLCGSSLIRVTSMHYIKSTRMFEDEVTSPG
jgi:hypothetical protein